MAVMSADIPSLLEQGFRPVYHKARGQWYVQKRINGRLVQKYVPKHHEPLVKSVYASLSDEHAKRLAEIEDARHIMSLRRARLDERKPLIAKEIECMAWFQHVTFDLGRGAYHMLVGSVEWDEMDMKDADRAVKRLLKRLKSLLRLEEDAARLERLEQENERYLRMIKKLLERLEHVEAQRDWLLMAANIMIGSMCAECSHEAALKMRTQGVCRVGTR